MAPSRALPVIWLTPLVRSGPGAVLARRLLLQGVGDTSPEETHLRKESSPCHAGAISWLRPLWPLPLPAQAGYGLDLDLETSLSSGSIVLQAGQELELTVRSDRDAYVTVHALGVGGRVMVLFPNEFQRDNLVRGGETIPLRPPPRNRDRPRLHRGGSFPFSPSSPFATEIPAPFWHPRWGTFSIMSSYLTDREMDFALAFDDGSATTRVASFSRTEAERLEEMVDEDYARFAGVVRDFRDEVYDMIYRYEWDASYQDIYVVDPRDLGGRDPYASPSVSYASYYEYEEAQFDYDVALSGYGSWVYVNGIRVWRPPTFGISWRPYTHGYWTRTRYGWYWVGYEPFAWVTYHYGYWY